jgi:hypothetical protein
MLQFSGMHRAYINTLQIAHENSRVCVSSIAEEFLFLSRFVCTPLTLFSEVTEVNYCTAVLSDAYTSVGYHDLSPHHISV